jgi:hypothetical protein
MNVTTRCAWQLFAKRVRSNGKQVAIRSYAEDSVKPPATSSEPQDLNQLNKDLKDLPDKSVFWEYGQEQTGHVYDKKPVKVRCVEGKIYMWCSCGRSNSQVSHNRFEKIKISQAIVTNCHFVCAPFAAVLRRNTSAKALQDRFEAGTVQVHGNQRLLVLQLQTDQNEAVL